MRSIGGEILAEAVGGEILVVAIDNKMRWVERALFHELGETEE
ncbi:hypothetical protein A2U01_0103498, partial [Trifolium medium]|nr:hypothetical protein [Trifolium medium]